MANQLTLLVLSHRESFKRQLLHEDLDPRVSLRWYPEQVDDYAGVVVDGLPDLAAWRGVLEQLDPARPILLVAANLAWSERRWLAQLPNVSLVRPAQHDLVDYMLAILDRHCARPQVAVYGSPPGIWSELGTVATYRQPEQLWRAFDEIAPGVAIFDLDSGDEPILLARALRQSQKASRAILVGCCQQQPPEEAWLLFDLVVHPDQRPEQVIEGILARYRRNQSIGRLIDNDPLTGLANRRKARARFAFLLRLARRQRTPLAVAVLDIDHFKTVNDAHGHAVGDKVIKTLARSLRHAFRHEDITSRIGGEEFLVAMYGAKVEVLLERLRQLLAGFSERNFRSQDGSQFRVTFSAGVAEAGVDGDDYDALYRAADERLYLAKSFGRNQVVSSS